MENTSEDINKYFMKELGIFRLAFGSRATLIKSVFIICVFFSSIFYFTSSSIYKSIFVIIFTCILAFFVEFIRYRIIHRNNGIIKKYSLKRSKFDVSKIIACLIMDYIYRKGLLDKEGLDYLINVYSKKSNKNRFQGIAIGVILVSAFTQTLVDFLLMSEQNDWDRLQSHYNFFINNAESIITIIIIVLIMIFLMRYSYNELISTFINRKSNNYQLLADYLEGRILPLVLKYSFLETREIQYRHILGSLDIDSFVFNLRCNKDDKNSVVDKQPKIKILKKGDKYHICKLPHYKVKSSKPISSLVVKQ